MLKADSKLNIEQSSISQASVDKEAESQENVDQGSPAIEMDVQEDDKYNSNTSLAEISVDDSDQHKNADVKENEAKSVPLQKSQIPLDEQNWAIDDTDSCDEQYDDETDVDPRPVSYDEAIDDEDCEEQVPISACGTVDIAMQYMLSEKKLLITIIDAKDVPTKDRGGASVVQVRVVVLPAKRKRYKTKVQHVKSAHFAETFKLSNILPEDLCGLGLRVRLYGIGKVKERLVGEARVRFDELNLILNPQLTVTLQLEPRTDVNQSNSEFKSEGSDTRSIKTLTYGGGEPQILLSLSYNKMTGKLGVEVVKGSHFHNLAIGKPPDTHVKLVLLNSTFQEMAQSKTSIRKAQPNPVFRETFYFQVATIQLPEVSLMVSVYCSYKIKRKNMLGWITIGSSSSGDSDEQHWQEMQQADGKPVSRWHTLIDS